MKIWLARHGFAGSPSPDPAKERARVLQPVGIKQIAAIADRLQADKEFPSVVFASPLVRTQQTADILASVLACPVMMLDDLGPHLPLHPVIKRMARYPDVHRVMIVGHHDNFEPTVEAMGGGKASDLFVTGEVRRYRLDRDALTLDERYRLTPDMVGQPNMLGYGSAA